MSKFDHPNVLTLNGVCLDGGPAPFIIMPFMMNGSLLAYLRKNRATLVISGENQDDEDVSRDEPWTYSYMLKSIYRSLNCSPEPLLYRSR